MNRKIKTYRFITCMILFYLAAACFLLGPVGVLKKDRLLAGNEVPAGTAQVRLDQQIQQVFIADGTYLRYLEVYAASEDSAGERYHLYVYDEQNQVLVNREITMPEVELPGFLRIPMGIETVPGRAYVWQLQGTDTPMDLYYENTADTGLTVFGNYYISADGIQQEQAAQNIVMRLIYTDSPSSGKMALLYAGLFGVAAVCIGIAEYQGRVRHRGTKKLRIQRLVQLTVGPVLAGFTGYLLYAVYVQRLFGSQKENLIVFGLGIGLAALYFGWVLFAGRTGKQLPSIEQLCKDHAGDWLQAGAFAGMLWGGIHFMNAQFQIYQDIAYREVLAWAFLFLLTFTKAKYLLEVKNLLWGVPVWLAGFGYCQYHQLQLAKEAAALQQQMLKTELVAVLLAGLLAAALAGKSRSRDFVFGHVNRLYAGLLAALLALLVLLRNTRGWPVYLAVVFGLYYLLYISWEHRDRLLANLCNGIVLNFALATLFALARRPFRAWVYSRYNFVFHTVTITATYLTLVLCALTVRLLFKLRKEKRLVDLWGTLLLYGMAASFLFLTLSRTGYLAVVVMTVLLVPFVTFFCYRQRAGAFCKNVLVMAAAALLCLPVTFSGIRLLPALYNDPYIYEIEDSAAAIHKDDPKDSTGYMSVPYFYHVMEDKLLDASQLEEEAKEMMLCLTEPLYVYPRQTLVASAEESAMETAEDFSNGRLEIFKSYISHWNLLGHEEMGVPLPDGSISVHAHNSYLQVIHDHGLLTGGLYLILGLVSVGLMFLYALQQNKTDPYAVLPLAVFIGFAVAGLVEWLFHPCNPLGFSAMTVIAPLLCFHPKKKG